MRKIRVGLLSFSDGRKSVHQELKAYIAERGEQIKKALEATNEIEVLEASEIVWSNRLAKEKALEVKRMLPDAMIFNIPVFAFPNFALVAESVLRIPTLVISNRNGKLPGLGGLQAASNLIRQCGYSCEKIWDDIEKPEVLYQCMEFLRAAFAASELRGQVFGLIGGRSIGMGSGTANPDYWQAVFGVDIDHVDQSEILRRSRQISEERVQNAAEWLKQHLKIRYDGQKLTDESLQEQIKNYCAAKDLCTEQGYSFAAVKCHTEMSAYHCTQCLTTAFMNDPYDWEGEKEPFVMACEADAEAALTMQVMKLLSGCPAIFADFRYYDERKGCFFFCNCGSMATWYTERSEDTAANLKSVELVPIIPKYAGKGAHVSFIARKGKMTFGRITHELGKFKFTVFTGTAESGTKEDMKLTCEAWPHIFVRPDPDQRQILERYDCNHIHGIPGDHVNEIKHFCEITGIEFQLIQ